MNVCRFQEGDGPVRVGLVSESSVLDLTPAGIDRLHQLLETENPAAELRKLTGARLPRLELSQVKLCAPVERQEVWAAGVTYLRSKTARMDESDFSATAYDRVYGAERPELFFKSMPEKVVGPGDSVGIRRDARWSVPEPELALVLNSRGQIAGLTIGNDMSSRDIEGGNLLYLPQAKIYQRSCALGPWIHIGTNEPAARQWTVRVAVQRGSQTIFEGETSIGRMKRSFEGLAEFLFRSQVFPHGAILLTGTGIVPPETFTLNETDVIRIEISGIGVLVNKVAVV
jgi:2-dehydro-3-deoxy-D-arabinonate dehydratase